MQVQLSGMEKCWLGVGVVVGVGGYGASHPCLPVTDKAARHERQLILLLLNC